MNKKTAIGLIVGAIFFFISLFTIKDYVYYKDATSIPKHTYTEAVEYYTNEKKKYENKPQLVESYKYSKTQLERHTREGRYNYPIALVFLIAGIGVGYLWAERREKSKQ